MKPSHQRYKKKWEKKEGKKAKESLCIKCILKWDMQWSTETNNQTNNCHVAYFTIMPNINKYMNVQIWTKPQKKMKSLLWLVTKINTNSMLPFQNIILNENSIDRHIKNNHIALAKAQPKISFKKWKVPPCLVLLCFFHFHIVVNFPMTNKAVSRVRTHKQMSSSGWRGV